VAAIFLALAALCGDATAQGCGADTLPVPDLPFLHETGLWAREAGMGDAHLAVGSDASSLHDNPAGLALIRRIEMSASVQQNTLDVTTASFGTSRMQSTTATSLSTAAVAYPFPVYRGSFVVAVSYERPIGFDLRSLRVGTRPSSDGDVTETDRVVEEGGVRMYRAGFAVDVAREVSVGASGFLIGGSDRRTHTAEATLGGVSGPQIVLETSTNVRGYGGTVGALFRLSPYARLGTAVELPRHVNFKGTGRDTSESFALVPQKFRLPFTFSAGLAVTPPYAILAADIAYTNWSELQYDADPIFGRVTFRDQDAYKATTDVRVGAELLVPHTLLRLRAGYQSTPLPLQFLPDLSDESGCLVYAPVQNTQSRHAVTLGVGYLIADAFTVDLAWVRESFSRHTVQESQPSTSPAFEEERTSRRLFGTVAFRL
jgi:long-subunit fatty acid transport protein